MPVGCPKPLYGIIHNCWRPTPENRPTFASLRDRLANPTKPGKKSALPPKPPAAAAAAATAAAAAAAAAAGGGAFDYDSDDYLKPGAGAGSGAGAGAGGADSDSDDDYAAYAETPIVHGSDDDGSEDDYAVVGDCDTHGAGVPAPAPAQATDEYMEVAVVLQNASIHPHHDSEEDEEEEEEDYGDVVEYIGSSDDDDELDLDEMDYGSSIAPGGQAAAATNAEMGAFSANALRMSKYIAPAMSLGFPKEVALGLPELLGVKHVLANIIGMKEVAIINEFTKHGTPEDKENLKHILAGTYRKEWGRSKAQSVTLEALLATKQAQMAKLEKHHVLALRLYTTSSFKCVNMPLRRNPRPKQHPFGATVLAISDGIKQLRAVEAEPEDGSDVLEVKIFWRGMKNRSLPREFEKIGGAEYACMSTTTDFDVAVRFATAKGGKTPLLFKYTTGSIMNRGADISFLSVYPEEKEVLFPPLTYLKPVKVEHRVIKGKRFIVAEVVPEY